MRKTLVGEVLGVQIYCFSASNILLEAFNPWFSWCLVFYTTSTLSLFALLL